MSAFAVAATDIPVRFETIGARVDAPQRLQSGRSMHALILRSRRKPVACIRCTAQRVRGSLRYVQVARVPRCGTTNWHDKRAWAEARHEAVARASLNKS